MNERGEKIKVIIVVTLLTAFLGVLSGFLLGGSREQQQGCSELFGLGPFYPWFFAVLYEKNVGFKLDFGSVIWLSIWPPIAAMPLVSYWNSGKKVRLIVFPFLWFSIGILWFMALST